MLALIGLAMAPDSAQARVSSFTILETSEPAYAGRSFGAAGAYRAIRAEATFAVRPDAPGNRGIVDIDKAPTDSNGDVAFSTSVLILQPVDAARGNRSIFYEVPNRGRNLSVALLNDGPVNPDTVKEADAGNGYLMEQGYTIVLSGWQPDLPGKLLDIALPVARDTAGLSREEFIFEDDKPVSKASLTYPAADQDPAKATLTVRVRESDERQSVPDLSFKYLGPQQIEITRPAGMPAGAIYEFIYPARDSKVTGLGFAATRDLLSFLRGAPGHAAASPIGPIDRVIGLGISQSGRFVRDFVYQGFNADEGGRRVFDGVLAHIAGSRKTFTNYRFAQPGRYSRQHEDHTYPGDQFPFTYAEATDLVAGRSDSILRRCRANDTCPKLMHSDTGTEFWQGRASLVSTGVDGKPLVMPDDVRLYYLAGAQHFVVAGGKISASKECVFDNNVFHVGAVMRGLLSGMHAWVRDGITPPDSRFPDQVGTTLVVPAALDPVAIPGLAYAGLVNGLAVMDHDRMPPVAGESYPVHVPATDITGNVIDGVRMPWVAAPLGTHAGWNLRKKGFAEGELCSLSGSYIPFARTVAERKAGDARPAVEQLYKGKADYLARVDAAINDLLGQRLILRRDVGMLRQQADIDWARAMP